MEVQTNAVLHLQPSLVGLSMQWELTARHKSWLIKYLLLLLVLLTPQLATSQILKSDELHVETEPQINEQPSAKTEKKIQSFSRFNCYEYVQWRLDSYLPDDATIRAQKGLTAQQGLIAVFYYPKSNTWHFAVVEIVEEKGFWISECNYDSGVCGVRFIENGYYALKGFYNLGIL